VGSLGCAERHLQTNIGYLGETNELNSFDISSGQFVASCLKIAVEPK
tara:strand:- start:296 stop:436 length:141 start_codon:yes stop_codon:yes gene_type:complete